MAKETDTGRDGSIFCWLESPAAALASCRAAALRRGLPTDDHDFVFRHSESGKRHSICGPLPVGGRKRKTAK